MVMSTSFYNEEESSLAEIQQSLLTVTMTVTAAFAFSKLYRDAAAVNI